MNRPTDREIMQMDMAPATRREVAEVNIRLSRVAAGYRTTVVQMREICAPVKAGMHYQSKIILWLMRDGR